MGTWEHGIPFVRYGNYFLFVFCTQDSRTVLVLDVGAAPNLTNMNIPFVCSLDDDHSCFCGSVKQVKNIVEFCYFTVLDLLYFWTLFVKY